MSLELKTLIKEIRNCDNSLECKIAMPKLIRQLYKEVEPTLTEENFPDIFYTAGKSWRREKGYTTGIITHDTADSWSTLPTKQLRYPSDYKLALREKYRNWAIEEFAQQVVCRRIVWVDEDYGILFRVTRDNNWYEIIIKERKD